MRLSSLVVVTASVIGLSLIACSSPTSSSLPSDSKSGDSTSSDGTTPSDSSDPSSTSSPSSSSSSGSTTTPTTTSTTTTTAGGQCTNADSDTCQTCCYNQTADTKAAEAKEVTIDTQWQACACASTRCATACATDPYCKPGGDPEGDDDDDAVDACTACLDSDTTNDCDTQTDAAYTANEATPGYTAITACETKSSCPEGDDDDDDDNTNN